MMIVCTSAVNAGPPIGSYMSEAVDAAVELVLVVVSFLGAFYALSAYRAFKHDVMERVFGYLAAAMLLVGGGAVLLLLGGAMGVADGYEDTMYLIILVSFTLILGGLIPLFRLLRGATEEKSGR